MSHSDTFLLTIGQFRVEPSLGEISREGARVRLEPRAMQLLHEIEMIRMIPMRDGTEQAWITKPSATKEPAPALQVPLAAARVAIH